jgi:anaerobic selenocysteine-containing dehydrogenase
MSKERKSLPRRDFLKAAGIAGGAAGLAAATSSSKSQAAVPAGRKSAGYRETEHIRKYYESARY